MERQKRRQSKTHRSRFGIEIQERRKRASRSVTKAYKLVTHFMFLKKPKEMWELLFNYFWRLDCVSFVWYGANTGPYGALEFMWIINEACMHGPSQYEAFSTKRLYVPQYFVCIFITHIQGLWFQPHLLPLLGLTHA